MQNAGHQQQQHSHRNSRAMSAEEKARSSRIEALKSDSREFPAKPSTRKYRWRPMLASETEKPKKIPMLNTYTDRTVELNWLLHCNCLLSNLLKSRLNSLIFLVYSFDIFVRSRIAMIVITSLYHLCSFCSKYTVSKTHFKCDISKTWNIVPKKRTSKVLKLVQIDMKSVFEVIFAYCATPSGCCTFLALQHCSGR